MKELVWVEAEFAKKYKEITEDAQIKAFSEYLAKSTEDA